MRCVGFGSSDVTIDNVTVVAPVPDVSTTTVDQLASASFDGFKGDATDTTISAKYVMGATTIKANYQVKSLDVSRAADATTVAGVSDTALITSTFTHEITALAKTDVSASATSMGVSVSHTIDALTINAFGSSTELDLGKLAATTTRTATGLGVSYDLGGGASMSAGVANFTTPSLAQNSITEGATLAAADTGVAGKVTQTSSNLYSIGVSFSF
jgi:hypothetical protein